MADITKCSTEKCPKRKTCYRYTAFISHQQSFDNFYKENEECEMYWELTDKCPKTNKEEMDQLIEVFQEFIKEEQQN